MLSGGQRQVTKQTIELSQSRHSQQVHQDEKQALGQATVHGVEHILWTQGGQRRLEPKQWRHWPAAHA